MKDLKVQIKRQVELLGLVIANPGKYSNADFEIMFDVSNLTIKRDMQVLRSMGIDIHSNGKKGIAVHDKIDTNTLKEIISQYMGIAVNRNSYNQATNLLVKKLKHKSVGVITLLQKAIEEKRLIEIEYYKTEIKEVEIRELAPICLFQSEKNWRLLAQNKGIVKQFLINHIRSVKHLEKNFSPPAQKEIEEIFSTSFRSWLGSDRFKVRLQFSDPWSERIKPRYLMEMEEIKDNGDGTIIYETTVNSLSEIASWIVSRGKGVIVLEPKELKDMVISLAENTLKNYLK